MALVAIDPGHGWRRSGWKPAVVAEQRDGAARQKGKNLVQDIGLKCGDILRRQGITVLMTRDSDVNVGLYDRAHVVRDNRAAAFVSIHLNGSQLGVVGPASHATAIA